jgi:hypothetical protein
MRQVRCEAGTYAWPQEKCPSVPIPRLYGSGLSTGQTVYQLYVYSKKNDCLHPLVHASRQPAFIAWTVQGLRRRLLDWLGYPTPSQYLQHQTKDKIALDTPYHLIENITPSRPKCFLEHGRPLKLRKNLFHSISRIMIALALTPLPKIGSFVSTRIGSWF